jgi:hypothetical protein
MKDKRKGREETSAALFIQRNWRGYLGRQKYFGELLAAERNRVKKSKNHKKPLSTTPLSGKSVPQQRHSSNVKESHKAMRNYSQDEVEDEYDLVDDDSIDLSRNKSNGRASSRDTVNEEAEEEEEEIIVYKATKKQDLPMIRVDPMSSLRKSQEKPIISPSYHSQNGFPQYSSVSPSHKNSTASASHQKASHGINGQSVDSLGGNEWEEEEGDEREQGEDEEDYPHTLHDIEEEDDEMLRDSLTRTVNAIPTIKINKTPTHHQQQLLVNKQQQSNNKTPTSSHHQSLRSSKQVQPSSKRVPSYDEQDEEVEELDRRQVSSRGRGDEDVDELSPRHIVEDEDDDDDGEDSLELPIQKIIKKNIPPVTIMKQPMQQQKPLPVSSSMKPAIQQQQQHREQKQDNKLTNIPKPSTKRVISEPMKVKQSPNILLDGDNDDDVVVVDDDRLQHYHPDYDHHPTTLKQHHSFSGVPSSSLSLAHHPSPHQQQQQHSHHQPAIVKKNHLEENEDPLKNIIDKEKFERLKRLYEESSSANNAVFPTSSSSSSPSRKQNQQYQHFEDHQPQHVPPPSYLQPPPQQQQRQYQQPSKHQPQQPFERNDRNYMEQDDYHQRDNQQMMIVRQKSQLNDGRADPSYYDQRQPHQQQQHRNDNLGYHPSRYVEEDNGVDENRNKAKNYPQNGMMYQQQHQQQPPPFPANNPQNYDHVGQPFPYFDAVSQKHQQQPQHKPQNHQGQPQPPRNQQPPPLQQEQRYVQQQQQQQLPIQNQKQLQPSPQMQLQQPPPLPQYPLPTKKGGKVPPPAQHPSQDQLQQAQRQPAAQPQQRPAPVPAAVAPQQQQHSQKPSQLPRQQEQRPLPQQQQQQQQQHQRQTKNDHLASSVEMEQQLLREIALLNQKQKHQIHHLFSAESSPQKQLVPSSSAPAAVPSSLNQDRSPPLQKQQQLPQQQQQQQSLVPKRPKVTDPTKEKEKRAFGPAAKDFNPRHRKEQQPQQQQEEGMKELPKKKQQPSIQNPSSAAIPDAKQIVKEWKEAALHDNHPPSKNNNFSPQRKVSPSHHPLPLPSHANPSAAAAAMMINQPTSYGNPSGYLQHFDIKHQHQQQKRSTSANRRRNVNDPYDSRSEGGYSQQRSQQAMIETASLPPLMSDQRLHQQQYIVDQQAGKYHHPLDTHSRRVPQNHSRNSSRSAPSAVN